MPSNKWVSPDGIVHTFGTHDTTTYPGASEGAGVGQFKEVVLKLPDLTLLGTDATAYTAGNYVTSAKIPGNATIQEVWITTDTAATSAGAADLLLGTFTVSSTTKALVAVDADGLAAAADSALSDFSVAGETMILGKAAGAAQLGKTLANAADSTTPVVVAATYVTAAFTAGAVTARIFYTV